MSDEKYAIWATMEARPGQEEDARQFLLEACKRLGSEAGTTNFYALEIGDRKFAIFNLLEDEAAIQAHVNGEVAKWVQSQQQRLFVGPYQITRTRILGTKAALA